MTLIEFHVHNSGTHISVNPDAIECIGEFGDDKERHAFLKYMDGSSVELKETYEAVVTALKRNA